MVNELTLEYPALVGKWSCRAALVTSFSTTVAGCPVWVVKIVGSETWSLVGASYRDDTFEPVHDFTASSDAMAYLNLIRDHNHPGT